MAGPGAFKLQHAAVGKAHKAHTGVFHIKCIGFDLARLRLLAAHAKLGKHRAAHADGLG